MSQKDFSIGTREFKLRKIDPFKQFHIARKMGPMLADLVPLLAKIKSATSDVGGMSPEDQVAVFGEIAAPIMNGLAKLSDDDANKVLFGLLTSAEMKQSSGNWARVATDTALMLQDLELPVLITVAVRAFMFNMSGFTLGPPQNS